MSVSRDGLSASDYPGLAFKLRLATQAGTYVKAWLPDGYNQIFKSYVTMNYGLCYTLL